MLFWGKDNSTGLLCIKIKVRNNQKFNNHSVLKTLTRNRKHCQALQNWQHTQPPGQIWHETAGDL